jgi:hypothetical protein
MPRSTNVFSSFQVEDRVPGSQQRSWTRGLLREITDGDHDMVEHNCIS